MKVFVVTPHDGTVWGVYIEPRDAWDKAAEVEEINAKNGNLDTRAFVNEVELK